MYCAWLKPIISPPISDFLSIKGITFFFLWSSSCEAEADLLKHSSFEAELSKCFFEVPSHSERVLVWSALRIKPATLSQTRITRMELIRLFPSLLNTRHVWNTQGRSHTPRVIMTHPMKLVALSPSLETLTQKEKEKKVHQNSFLLKYSLFKVDQALPLAWSTLYRRHPKPNLLSSPSLKYSHEAIRSPLCPSSAFA